MSGKIKRGQFEDNIAHLRHIIPNTWMIDVIGLLVIWFLMFINYLMPLIAKCPQPTDMTIIQLMTQGLLIAICGVLFQVLALLHAKGDIQPLSVLILFPVWAIAFIIHNVGFTLFWTDFSGDKITNCIQNPMFEDIANHSGVFAMWGGTAILFLACLAITIFIRIFNFHSNSF